MFDLTEGRSQGRVDGRLIWKDGCKPGAKDAVIAAGEEEGVAQPWVGHFVAVSARDSANEASQPEAAEVVGDRTRRRADTTQRLEPLA